MHKLILFFILISLVFAQEGIKKYSKDNNRIFELFADSLNTIDNNKIAIASGNAVLVSQDVYILADYIKYNMDTKEAEIRGNIKLYRNGNLYASAQSANIKFNDNFYMLEPFYMQESSTGIWVSATLAKSKGEEYKFRDMVVSSCDIQDPIWRIEGTSGSYNNNSSIASIWNPRIYIKDVPVFYFPYLFFSTNNQRTTGFLYPQFASSSLEGFVFIQPFFLALQDFWDMTFNPQIRTYRGWGLNTEFRIVDKQNRLFYFNLGYFMNFDKYVIRNNAKNKYIYGFDFRHERRGLLESYFDDGYMDGLYLNFRFMNDLDYIRLQNAESLDIEDRIQTSKANLFASKDDHYLGLYFKYFLDLQDVTNDSTFHTLPQLQYHKSLDQISIKNLSYSIDANSKNIVRYRGFGYFDNSVRIPLYFTLPLLANYLTFGATLNANAGVITLNRTQDLQNLQGKNSTYFSTNYGFFLSTDVAKQYDKIFHSMSLKAEFESNLYKYTSDRNNIFTPANATISDIRNSFSDSNIYVDTQPALQLSFSQYFFGLSGIDLLYHKMNQTINTQDKINRLDSLRNEIGFSPISNLNISNTIYYSYKNKNIDEISFSIDMQYGYFRGLLTYYLKRQFDNISEQCINNAGIEKCVSTTANFLRLQLSQDFSYFSIYGNLGYDFSKKYLRDWDIVVSKDIRCFGLGLKFANEITPILTTSGTRVITNRYVSLEFRFVPVTSTNVSYRVR